MNTAKRTAIFERFYEQNPKPTTELLYETPFELLVAVILSAQALDASVNKATRVLYPIANTPQAMLDLGLDALMDYLKSLNYYKTKAQNILKTAAILVQRFGGEVPRTRGDLEALPGVGRKTANVILNTLYGDPVVAVDTHIFRVANRTGLAKGKTPLEVELALTKNTPKRFLRDAHHWLVLHGRYVCKAAAPQCAQCLICDLCEFKGKPLPHKPS